MATASDYAAGARNSLIRIDVDADNMLARQFTALERTQLPFAVMQAVNATAFEIRETWKTTARRVFDRPTPLTINAVLYQKATRQRLFATVFIRDEAHKGTPPAKYLQPQVEGGQRRLKGMERLLQGANLMPQGRYAVPGKGAGVLRNVRLIRRVVVLCHLAPVGAVLDHAAEGRCHVTRDRRSRCVLGCYAVRGNVHGVRGVNRRGRGLHVGKDRIQRGAFTVGKG